MSKTEPAEQVVRRFFAVINQEGFRAASRLLSEDFVLEWPQSGERIRGRENWIAVNEQYPAAGPWRATLQRLVADDNGAATEVAWTDGAIVATAITFSEMRNGFIARQVEYWPDPFEAPPWRAPWIER